MGQTFHSFRIGQDIEPRDPNKPNKYLTGLEDGEVAAFANQQEMLDAMARPEYASDAEFREAVAVMISNSDFSGNHNAQAAAQRRTDWRAEEDRAILREHIQSLMSDPRYETSTLFRKQVREQIEANPHLFEQGAPTPTRISGRVQMDGDDFNTVRAALAKEREEKREQAKKDAIEAATRRAALPYIDVTTGEEYESSLPRRRRGGVLPAVFP